MYVTNYLNTRHYNRISVAANEQQPTQQEYLVITQRINDSKVFYVIGSIYATSKGFMILDDMGNLVPTNLQTNFLTYHQCD